MKYVSGWAVLSSSAMLRGATRKVLRLIGQYTQE